MELLSRRRALVWLLALGLSAAGAVGALSAPSGIYPEVEFPRVVVVARQGDGPPEVVQVALTRPLETALATVLGVQRIRSRTIRGAAELSLQFAPGTDLWRAHQLVEARVSDARSALPLGTEVVVERLTTTSFPVVTFNVTGEVDPRALRDAAELVLRPGLSRVPGVGRVEVLGGDVRELEVVLDPAKTAALHLSPSGVAEKLRAASVLQAVGRHDDAHAVVTVLLSSEPRGEEDLKATTVAVSAEGAAVPLSAIAEVFEGAEDRMLRVSGPGGETVLVSVSRLPGASTPEVVAAVAAALEALRPSLPDGVTVRAVYDQAALVDESMRSVRDAIVLGVLLCVAVIALFLGDLRAGLAAALAVPLTLAMTFLPVRALGQSLNLMSLGGLAVAIGLVIDDAIVVVEAIRRRLEEGDVPSAAAAAGVRGLLGPLVGTTLTTVVVFLPLAWLEGLVGRFFTALAVTLCAAVLLSLVVAVTVVPLAAARWMRRRPRPRAEPWYVRRYLKLLSWLLPRAWLGPVAAAGLLSVGAVSAVLVGTGFLPEMDEGAFVLDYFLPAGTSLTETDAVARRIEAVLMAVPEVDAYSRRTGAELGPATATLVSRGDIMVRLKPRAQRRRDAEAVVADARARLQVEVPEARVEFVQVLQDVLNDLAGTPRPIEVKLFGADYRVLHEKARALAERLKGVDGLVDLFPGVEGAAPQLRLRVDGAAAARLGLDAQALASDLDAALRGVVAATVPRADRPLGIRVRYGDAVRFDARAVLGLPILAGELGPTTLGAVVVAERSATETSLMRESLRPVVILTADTEGRDLGSVARDVQRALEGLELPPGYRVELGGQYEAQQQTFVDLAKVLAFGVLAVAVVLLGQFRAWVLGAVVLGSVPLAVVGALGTLWALHVPLNASSLMGCVLLVGLVVKNGILLLEHAEGRLAQGASLSQALLEAGAVRVRPIAMTTVATIAGLAPLALGLGSGAELQQPLALAVIGGLLVSTLVSLLLLPALVMLARRWVSP